LLVDGNISAPNIGLYLDLAHDATLHDVLQGNGLHTAIYESYGVDIVPSSLMSKEEADISKLKKIFRKT
jgi:MinD-like ATPase involved in chromosome partitioning or flagellar assembly